MHNYLILLLTLFLIGSIGSDFKNRTAQVPDEIIYNGKKFDLNSTPLETFFERYPEKKPKTDIISSANWRGYVAKFEILENEFYVTDIEITVSDKEHDSYPYKQKSVFKEVFPEASKVKLDWYNGILILPYGKLRNYVHMGFASTYSKYWLLEIKNGVLTEARNYNYKKFAQFKKRQFDKFKKTQGYKDLRESIKKDDPNYDDKFLDDFLKDFVINYTTEFLDD
ncbi:hypothetical protein A8B79_05515 [Balneola sp. EhC07]|nr:hypothetical protein A8B79_05515 [Balneola sp. EhC07]